MGANRRVIVARLALAACGVAVAVIGAEIALRLRAVAVDPGGRDLAVVLAESGTELSSNPSVCPDLRSVLRSSSHPDLVYELKPDLECVFKSVSIRTNSMGMRDREYPLVKDSATIRVAAAGDSVMFGWGVAVEEGFLRVAEQRLRYSETTHPAIEIMNFAVPGYNTAMQATALAEKAMRFEPDVIVIHVVNNDLDLPRFMFDPVDPWRMDRSWLVELLHSGGRAVTTDGRWLDPGDVRQMTAEGVARIHRRYGHLAGEQAFRDGLQRIAALAEQRSIPVILLAMQNHGQPWGLAMQSAERHGFELEVYGPRFNRYLADIGRGSRQGWIETFWLSPEDPHPNAVGHGLIADVLVAALEETLGLMSGKGES